MSILSNILKLRSKFLEDRIDPNRLELHITEELYSQMINELPKGIIISDRILGMKIKIGRRKNYDGNNYKILPSVNIRAEATCFTRGRLI